MYEIGFKHGRENRPVLDRADETYMNGWADGHWQWSANQSVMPIVEGYGQGIVANGGWCAPGDMYQIFVPTEPEGFLPDVQVRRGGTSFTAVDMPQPTDEERAEWRARDERARAERRAAGGEWRYAIRGTDEDGEVEIRDGSSVWDEGTKYLSAESAIEGEAWLFTDDGLSWEVVRRWVADPPEWETFTVATEEKKS